MATIVPRPLTQFSIAGNTAGIQTATFYNITLLQTEGPSYFYPQIPLTQAEPQNPAQEGYLAVNDKRAPAGPVEISGSVNGTWDLVDLIQPSSSIPYMLVATMDSKTPFLTTGSSGPHHPHPHPHPYPPHRPFVPQGSSQDDGEVLIFNSPANDPAFGAIMAVPSGNYGSSVTFWNTAQPAIRPPGVIRIPRGAMVSVPASSTVTYDLWVERTGDRGVAAPPQPLDDTYSLRFGMNDANRQTVYTNAATGATLYRAYLSSGKDVFVFGQVSAALASSDPVGQVGTFVYTDSKHSLRWTNAYNLPDEWIKAPVPPGFVLETPGGGSSWLPAPKPIRIYNSPLNDPSFHTLVAVPNANYGASVQDWETASPAVRGPGVVAITRGQLVELPTGSHIYDLWLMQGGSGSGSGSGSAVPMMSTYGLHSSMNDSNKQTASADMTTGAVFFRTFDAQGGEVYVFGRIDTMSGSGSGIGPLGTYAYTDPALNLSLTWTNVHNRPNDGLVSPLPPGFALQSTA